MLPLSSDTAATAGEHRYTQSLGVPERPRKLRLKVRSELAPDGGACPMPTHGPHTGSSIRTPPARSCDETPELMIASWIWRDPGVAVASTVGCTIWPPLSARIAPGSARSANAEFT